MLQIGHKGLTIVPDDIFKAVANLADDAALVNTRCGTGNSGEGNILTIGRTSRICGVSHTMSFVKAPVALIGSSVVCYLLWQVCFIVRELSSLFCYDTHKHGTDYASISVRIGNFLITFTGEKGDYRFILMFESHLDISICNQ